VDLGCGNGIWQQHLVWAGYDALGMDSSPAMIRLARNAVPLARFDVGDVTSYVVHRCVAVTSLGEVLSYAMEADSSGKQMRGLIRRVYRALRPGGLFLFDAATRGRNPSGMPRKGYWTGEDWAVLVKAEEDPTNHVLTRRLTSFRKWGSAYRRSDEVHRLRLFDPGELQGDLATAGFEVRRLRAFGQVRFQSGHMGFAARKP
jgi:SAM-dependent methyltransferase